MSENLQKLGNKQESIEKPSKEKLEDLYYNQCKTLKEISDMYLVSRSSIKRWCESYGIKIQHGKNKQARKVRSSVKLSQMQKEYLAGSLLGDDSLSLRNVSTGRARLHMAHCTKQLEYLKWKYDIMKPFFLADIKPYTYKGSAKFPYTFTIYKAVSIEHDELGAYYEMFYPLRTNRKKCVPDNIEDLLTAFSLAVWYMDDGSCSISRYKDSVYTKISLHTEGFAKTDVERLTDVLEKKFDIRATVHLSKTLPYIIIKDKDKFFDLIEPFVHISMGYKIIRSSTTIR